MLGKLGFMDFALREFRAYDQKRLVNMLTTYKLDGIQVEWVPSPRPHDDLEKDRTHTIDWCLDEEGYWGYGYDPGVVDRFQEQ
jgi:hypothetical protein